LIVQAAVASDDTQGLTKFVVIEPLHPDQQPAAMLTAARPLLNVRIKLFPPTQVEIADAEIGAR
jgi:hypothetical protein